MANLLEPVTHPETNHADSTLSAEVLRENVEAAQGSPELPQKLILRDPDELPAGRPTDETTERLLPRFEAFLIPALIFFLVGCALSYAIPELALSRWPIAVPLLLVFIGIVFYGAGKPENRWVIRLDFWMIFLIAGALFYETRHFTPGPGDVSQLAPLQRAEVIATITGKPAPGQVILSVTSVNGKKVTGQTIAYLPRSERDTPENAAMTPGTRVLLEGRLSLPLRNSVPGTFNQAEYMRSRHITAIIRHPDRIIAFETSGQPQFSLQRAADLLKRRVGETFSAVLPSPHAEILGGLVLGDRAIPVDRKTRQAFIQTGLIHVLAASGMNVGIITAATLWLMTRLKLSYRRRILVAMVAVAFYSLLTGMPPSIQRAATMLELALALKMLKRELSPVFLLCIASTLLVLADPDHIASIGFQFSVLTTFGLLTMLPPLQEKLGFYITRWLSGLILAPTIAQLWVWPLSIAYFNQFPLHAVPLNILALALVAPLTLIGFVAGTLSLIWQPLGMLISIPARPLLEGLLWLVRAGGDMQWAQWQVASPEPWRLVLLYGALFLLAAWTCGWVPEALRRPRWSPFRKVLAALLPVLAISGGLWAERGIARQESMIDLIPLSPRSEAAFIRAAGSGETLLIMPEMPGYFESRTLADYLRHRGIRRLSTLLLLPDDITGVRQGSPSGIALKSVRTDVLVASAHTRDTTPFSAEKKLALPIGGARLTIGPLVLEGTPQLLRLMQNHRCLLTLSSRYSAKDEMGGCAIQTVFSPGRVRFFPTASFHAGLDAAQFNRFTYAGSRLTLY